MSVSEMKQKLNKLEELKFELESVIGDVNNKTREIKYDDTPMNIYIHVESLAEKHGIDITYEVNSVREKVNQLESALYELVTPFEDKKWEVETKHDDLECDIEEIEYGYD